MTERTYRIGEAARLLKLESYVLRFWELEFSQLCPIRTPKGQRIYTEADIELLRRIRELLHEQGMTIEGARRILARDAFPEQEELTETVEKGDSPARELLCHVERELSAMQILLRRS